MSPTAIAARDEAPPAQVEVLEVARDADHPAGRMLVPSPRDLDAILRRIPAGRVLMLGALRSSLAHNHRADYTSPPATARQLAIVAAAAEAERPTLGGRIAPYWRVVADDGALLAALPGGLAAQARALAAEHVTVLHLGKVPKVTEVTHFAWIPPPLGKAPIVKHVAPRPRRR